MRKKENKKSKECYKVCNIIIFNISVFVSVLYQLLTAHVTEIFIKDADHSA